MKAFRQILIGALMFALIINLAKAQETNYRGWSLSLKGGVTKPLTDIRTYDFSWVNENGQNEMKFFGDLALTKMFNSSFGLQVNGWYGQLLGMATDKGNNVVEDEFQYERLGFAAPVYFKTSIYGGSGSFYIDFNSVAMQLNIANHKPNAKRIVGFYGMLGVGVNHFDSEIHDVATDTVYQTSQKVATKFGDIKVGGYLRGYTGATWETEWPITLGMKFRLSRSFDLGLEGTMHKMTTDKLDGYVGDLANSFKKLNDAYMTLGLSVTYKFVGSDPNTEYIEWKDPTDDMYNDMQAMKDKMAKLSTDTDNDGVPDMFDKEPNTPQGYKVYGSGESVDSDKDGVPDGKDEDLFSPKSCTVNSDGIPADGDGDGVPDCLDKEPGTKKGDLVNFQGVTIPKNTSTGGSGAYALPTIFFDTDKSDIKPMYYPELAELASLMKQMPNMKIKVSGNCDERASDSYNQGLGQRRADAVKNFLVKNYGIDGARISTESKGESSPINKPLYSINRRVEITEVK